MASSFPVLNRITLFSVYGSLCIVLGAGTSYGDGLFKSTDAGDTVQKVASFGVPVNAIQVNPANSRILYAGTGMFCAPTAPGGVYKSIDGGQTWTTPGTGVIVNAPALDRQSPDTLYAVCGNGAGSAAAMMQFSGSGLGVSSPAWPPLVSQESLLPETIGSLRVESDSSLLKGYTAFCRRGFYRAAIPAAWKVATGDLCVGHVPWDPMRGTRLSVLNTTAAAKTVRFECNDGTVMDRTIGAEGHQKCLVSDLFGGQTPEGLRRQWSAMPAVA